MFITNYQSSIITYPGNGSFYFPSTTISSQLAAILRFRLLSVFSMRADKINPSFFQPFSQWIRICSFIINQTCNLFSRTPSTFTRYRYLIKRCFYQLYFRRGCRVQVVPQRNSFAACHHHPLCTLSTFGFSNAEPPFLAGEKLPSANVSAQSSWPLLSNSERNARHASSQTSCSSHSTSLRQQVDADGYDSGRSFQRAPLRNTQRIPSNTRRLSIGGRPPLRDLLLGLGRSFDIFSHCASVNSDFFFRICRVLLNCYSKELCFCKSNYDQSKSLAFYYETLIYNVWVLKLLIATFQVIHWK